MASTSPVIFVCFFATTLLQGTVHSLDSCEPEGSIQLAVNDTQEYIDSNNQTYHLLQVCLFGHWSYVCYNGFNNGDRNVALHQLGCTQGGATNFTSNGSLPVYLTNIVCFQVERRLVECRRPQLNNITNCNTRVGVYCTEYGNFTCQNGELQRDNTTNTLSICINGRWRSLCYNEYFWGPTQATVACRELNPGKMVTNARVIGLNGISTPPILRYNFYCTGDEARLTDCVISVINNNICVDRRVGLLCETEDTMCVDKPQPVVSTEMLTSTQTVTLTLLCSTCISMSTTSASVTSSCTAKQDGPKFLGATSSVTSTPASCSSLPWVGGGIIGAVLSTAILLTVLAAVCLLMRRKRTYTQHKMSNNVLDDDSASPVLINHSNVLYCDSTMQAKQLPQPYEEVQLKEAEPEYSYATHGVDMNTYDSVAHDENGGCDAGNPKEQVHVVDNTPLYSLCEETSENEMYSKLDRK